MPQNTSAATQPDPRTLAEIEQRRAALHRLAGRPQPKPLLRPSEPQIDLIDPPSVKQSPQAPPPQSPQPVLTEAALYGLAGSAVRAIAPHTEAHPAAVLLQLLAAFGNVVGPGPHCMVGPTRHGLNLFVVLVGESSKARKGTSWNQIARLFSEIDHPWLENRVTTAALTPVGLIHALRDQQPPTDRRLLALSEEFASVLQSLSRSRGQLSPLLRCAWDRGDLRTLDRHRPLRATGTHISLIAHITQRDLAHRLHPAEAQNGFANRCLWTCVERGRCLPEGGTLSAEENSAVARELRRALDWATGEKQILFQRDQAARELWNDVYPVLSQARPGLYGAATSRAEAQVLRLSAVYAALDCSAVVTLPHLQAALAVWNYCSASAPLLFGDCIGDYVADRIKEAINAAPKGLSKTQILGLFHGHIGSGRIDSALEQLMSLGALGCSSQPTGGRPTTLWSAMAEARAPQQQAPIFSEAT